MKKKFCCWYTKSFITLLFVEQAPNGSSVQKVVTADDEARNAMHYYSILY